MISEAILIRKIYARLQKIAPNFQVLGSGFRLLTGTLSKYPGSVPAEYAPRTEFETTLIGVGILLPVPIATRTCLATEILYVSIQRLCMGCRMIKPGTKF